MLFNGVLQVVSMKDAGIIKEIPEPFATLEENASAKSGAVFELTGQDCFSEDTGLEVNALNGSPGVKSARYNEDGTFESVTSKLLFELQNTDDRSARFRTVLSLIYEGNEYIFEGICNGKIALQETGKEGFGYDSVFIPDGADKTFGEMPMEEKNKFSHRKKAVAKLIAFFTDRDTWK